MPEELTIRIVDQGATPTAGAPAQPRLPAGSPAGRGPRQRAGFASATDIAGAATTGGATAAIAGATVALGALTLATAGVTAAFGASVLAVRQFARVIENQAQLLEGFSAEVSAAVTETALRREAALLQRGQRIGPDVARAERLRSRFEDRITDIGTEILNILLKILQLLEPAIDFVLTNMETVNEHLMAVSAAFDGFIAGVSAFFEGKSFEDILQAMNEAILEAIKEGAQEPEVDEFFQIFRDWQNPEKPLVAPATE